jgi:SAM-dependent methyltransferase
LQSEQIPRSVVIPIIDFSPHSPYNIRTLLTDLEGVSGEVICIFNSREVYDTLKDHPRIDKYCFNNLNAGVSRSWNMGIDMAEGKAVYIMNSDLKIGPAAIPELEKYLFSLDRAVIVGPQGSWIDYRHLCDIRYFQKGNFAEPISCDGVSGFFFAIHLERFLENGLTFDVRYSPCFFEEWDMGLQLKRAGLACYAVPVTDFEHHWGISQSEGDTPIHYFGRTLYRNDILLANREKFVQKWRRVIDGADASVRPKPVQQADSSPRKRTDPEVFPAIGVERLLDFIAKVQEQSYAEPVTVEHTQITVQMVNEFFGRYSLPAPARILDVGCGPGVALDLFREKGHRATGITISDEDIKVCRARDHHILKMDQSFLMFPDGSFDFVWVRHCIEHSLFPFFTLSEFFRVLDSGGYLYLEMPAPGTTGRHESNINHYSIMSKEMWASLIGRAGFVLLEAINLNFDSPAGAEEYWAFICRKPTIDMRDIH